MPQQSKQCTVGKKNKKKKHANVRRVRNFGIILLCIFAKSLSSVICYTPDLRVPKERKGRCVAQDPLNFRCGAWSPIVLLLLALTLFHRKVWSPKITDPREPEAMLFEGVWEGVGARLELCSPEPPLGP